MQKGLITPNTRHLSYEKYVPVVALAAAVLAIVLVALTRGV